MRGRSRVAEALNRSFGRGHECVTQGAICLSLSSDPVHLPQADSTQGNIAHDSNHISEYPFHPFEVVETTNKKNHHGSGGDPYVAPFELLPE